MGRKRKPAPRKAMKRVGRDSSVEEKIVQSAERLAGENKAARRKPRQYKDPNGSFSRLKSVKPDPRVWKEATRLAKGDPKRLYIDRDHLDVTGNPSVIVWNPKD